MGGLLQEAVCSATTVHLVNQTLQVEILLWYFPAKSFCKTQHDIGKTEKEADKIDETTTNQRGVYCRQLCLPIKLHLFYTV